MSGRTEQDDDRPFRIDVTVVKPGQMAEMARSGAVPSPKFREAIRRAAARRGRVWRGDPDAES